MAASSRRIKVLLEPDVLEDFASTQNSHLQVYYDGSNVYLLPERKQYAIIIIQDIDVDPDGMFLLLHFKRSELPSLGQTDVSKLRKLTPKSIVVKARAFSHQFEGNDSCFALELHDCLVSDNQDIVGNLDSLEDLVKFEKNTQPLIREEPQEEEEVSTSSTQYVEPSPSPWYGRDPLPFQNHY